ncbi:MAG: AraC family transcriptional regulator [Oceanococcus sp.]
MSDPYGLNLPTLPLAYAELVLEIAHSRGVSNVVVLNEAGLASDFNPAQQERITPWQYTLITLAAAKLVDDQGLGIEVGLRMRPTAHGYLGYALISCSSLREALRLSLHFMRIRQRHIGVYYSSEVGVGVIRLQELHNFGRVRHFFVEGMLIGMARSLQFLSDDKQLPFELWLDYPEPDYFDAYREELPQLRFGMPEVQLRLESSFLDRPLRLADPSSARQAIALCEQELERTGQGEFLIPTVRSLLLDRLDAPPQVAELAASLCMSERSFKRKLHQQGLSFQKLLDEIRQEQAKRMLRQNPASIQSVGQQLGYEEPASFTRAFKKWTGMTPSQFGRGLSES